MLKISPRVPIKETYEYLSKFPRFSLIEKIQPKFFTTAQQASVKLAQVIKAEIEKKNKQGKIFVLGLATGNTPILLYKQLIRLHKEEGLSFKQVVTFNLDEYYPISKNDPESYNYYMRTNLFDHIDIPVENINIPSGEIQKSKVTKFCSDYEEKIKSYGGIDLQILGIGRTGHIGFNQPPSPINSVTRLVYLHRLTRKDAAPAFGGYEKVPKCAITMGINTIKKAKKIIIMAWSENKTYIVKRSIQGQISNDIPSTFLHDHSDAVFYLDKAAGQSLQRFNHPWTIKGDTQDPIVPKSQYWILKCVVWLSLKLKKPILRLQFQDYQDNNLADLVSQCANGRVEDLNLFVYKKILKKITGWPLGNKPYQENEQKITKMTLQPHKIVVFSPHPDDDVISMGGTIKRLVQQGNDVHVVYMTSGSNGVFDFDARKYFYFLQDLSTKYMFQKKQKKQTQNKSEVQKNQNFFTMFNGFQTLMKQAGEYFQKQKKGEHVKSEFVKDIKMFIRSSQAKIAVSDLGVPSSNVHSLNLPFYNSNEKKKVPKQEDYKLVRSFLRFLEADFIYAAGDLSDPHGTHRICLQILIRLHEEQQQKIKQDPKYVSFMPPADKIFLYRGAWEQWQIPMARHIVPMSPKDVDVKTISILKHQSQKDNPMFPGDDKREFWQRVKIRNRNTAQVLKLIGFTEYEAAQAFVHLDDLIEYDQI